MMHATTGVTLAVWLSSTVLLLGKVQRRCTNPLRASGSCPTSDRIYIPLDHLLQDDLALPAWFSILWA